MKVLVTAGNTQTPIDQVRCITNIFTGKTGAQIAMHGAAINHDVTFLTSHPEQAIDTQKPLQIRSYRTFDELQDLMEKAVLSEDFDVIIHAAAVSDFHVDGVFGLPTTSHFNEAENSFDSRIEFVDVSAGKVKSHHRELWLRLLPTPKLVDRIRNEWGYNKLLIKFKLEVGVSESELLSIAEKSRLQSKANLMVANTFESRYDWALIGAGEYQKVSRSDLPKTLFQKIEKAL